MTEQERAEFEAFYAKQVPAWHQAISRPVAEATWLAARRPQSEQVQELPWKVLHGGEVQAAFRNETDARHSIRNEPSRTKLTITGPSDIDRDADTTIATLTAERERFLGLLVSLHNQSGLSEWLCQHNEELQDALFQAAQEQDDE